MRKSTLLGIMFAAVLGLAMAPVHAVEDYVIDTEHTFINFRISNLGIAWVTGRFNTFEGEFSYDADNPGAANVEITIDTASIDSNHAERDRHLRSDDFLDVARFPTASFVATGLESTGDNTGTLSGELTLHGVTQPVTIEVEYGGAGPDPWGGYRRGFEGRTRLTLADFGIDYDLGPAAREVELTLLVMGIRQ